MPTNLSAAPSAERRNFPIGVFDSGIGGLSVVRALIEKLPSESIAYFGDTARVPYGVKSVATIRHFTEQITRFLLAQPVKMLIIACNTMAAVATDVVQQCAVLPVINVIDAGAACAVQHSRTHQVAVIGTLTTIRSKAYEHAIQSRAAHITVISQACPLFVPLVEEGWLDHPVTRLTAEYYLRPFLNPSIDMMILGCTHYPLITPLLQQLVGGQVELIDSATAVAEQAAGLLRTHHLSTLSFFPPKHHFYVTDFPLRFKEIGERFLGQTLPTVEHVALHNEPSF